MRRKNSFIILFSCLLLSSTLFSKADHREYDLFFNNKYLDINYKRELLSFVMIYYYQLKSSHNNSLLTSLIYLLSKVKKISKEDAQRSIEKELTKTDSPVDFYKNILLEVSKER